MGILDWFRKRRGKSSDSQGRAKTARFVAISENDNLLLPDQIAFMKACVGTVRTDILELQDPRIDQMVPECAMFVPNLMGEFNENPKLAMIHGCGAAHAWIEVDKLRAVLAAKGGQITDYRSLFRAFTELGYDIKKIKYIRFRSTL